MRIKSIKINNFRSLGGCKNRINVDDKVTTIIGKNESGKTNILKAMDKLNLFANPALGLINKNRFNSDAVSVEMVAEFLPSESKIRSETLFKFTEREVKFEGGLSEFFVANAAIKQGIAYFESKQPQNTTTSTGREYVAALSRIKNMGTMSNSQVNSATIRTQLFNCIVTTEQEEASEKFEAMLNELNNFWQLFPIFYLYNDTALQDKYTQDEVVRELRQSQPNKLAKLFTHLQVIQTDLIAAMQPGDNPVASQKRREISGKFNEQIGKKFAEFYTQEKVNITLKFDTGQLFFEVDSDNMPFKLSERSNGLQWYFKLFVSLLTEGYINRNIVLLIDEPGVHLHINAQSESLKFFEHLCSQNKQVIFTTHSPFMIDAEKLDRIRPVEKVEGVTKIHNKHYSELSDATKRETLSPLLKAIGAKFSNLSPDLAQLNIVTEGITEFYYLKAMMKCLGITKKSEPFIVPCVGVSEENAVASILIGWGCEFKCLIDYDNAGYNESTNLQKLGIESVDIVTVNTKPINKADMQANGETIESLLSTEDIAKLPSGDKTIIAKRFYDLVTSGELKPTKETAENFKRLFIVLGIRGKERKKTQNNQSTFLR